MYEQSSGADLPRTSEVHMIIRGRRPAAMTTYRLYLLGPTGRIEAVQRFAAESDKNAVALGRRYLTNDSWFGGFELWVDNRRVYLETRKRRQRSRRLLKAKPAPQRPG
jgi:hypothetical protein